MIRDKSLPMIHRRERRERRVSSQYDSFAEALINPLSLRERVGVRAEERLVVLYFKLFIIGPRHGEVFDSPGLEDLATLSHGERAFSEPSAINLCYLCVSVVNHLKRLSTACSPKHFTPCGASVRRSYLRQ